MGDVAFTIWALDWVGKVDVCRAWVHWAFRRHHWVGDDDLLTGDQGVVCRRVEVEMRMRAIRILGVRRIAAIVTGQAD